MCRGILQCVVVLALTSAAPVHAGGWDAVKGLMRFALSRSQHSQILVRNMAKLGVKCARDRHAHHLIPVELAKHRALRKGGFDINAAANGICLPTSVHQGYHAGYNAAVKQVLESIPPTWSPQRTHQAIERLQLCLRRGIEAGEPLYGEAVGWVQRQCNL